jgi:hypothetical protein
MQSVNSGPLLPEKDKRCSSIVRVKRQNVWGIIVTCTTVSDETADGWQFAAPRCQVEGRVPLLVDGVGVGTPLDERGNHRCVGALGGKVERSLSAVAHRLCERANRMVSHPQLSTATNRSNMLGGARLDRSNEPV